MKPRPGGGHDVARGGGPAELAAAPGAAGLEPVASILSRLGPQLSSDAGRAVAEGIQASDDAAAAIEALLDGLDVPLVDAARALDGLGCFAEAPGIERAREHLRAAFAELDPADDRLLVARLAVAEASRVLELVTPGAGGGAASEGLGVDRA